MKNRKTKGGFVEAINSEYVKIVTDSEGRLRFYIDDVSAVIDKEKLLELLASAEKYRKEQRVRLSEIILDWEGYKYYPDLRQTRVKASYFKSKEFVAAYNKVTDTVLIDVYNIDIDYENYISFYKEKAESKPRNLIERMRIEKNSKRDREDYFICASIVLLFHELQHAIQKREKITTYSFEDKDMLKYLRLKYNFKDLSDDEVKRKVSKIHHTNFEEAKAIEYDEMPTEKEALEVEKQFKHFNLDLYALGGVLNKKYKLKNLFNMEKENLEDLPEEVKRRIPTQEEEKEWEESLKIPGALIYTPSRVYREAIRKRAQENKKQP